MLAHLAAMVVFRDAGHNDRADEFLRQAKENAQELERFPAIPKSYETRWQYLKLTAQDEAAYEVARKGYEEAESAVTRLSLCGFAL